MLFYCIILTEVRYESLTYSVKYSDCTSDNKLEMSHQNGNDMFN